jgi:zinc transport system substrate-binding protein
VHSGSLAAVRTRIVLILGAVVCAATACGDGNGDAAAAGETSVVASFYPLAYAAEEIAGEGHAVTNLTPPGAEPHDVELSVRDVERVRGADVVLYLGSGFQPAVERALAGADVSAVDLLAGVELVEGDPHAWLDPLAYATMAERIGAALDRRAEADDFARRLEGLHRRFEQGLRDCERREIVTSHAAFGYLAERYDLEQLPLTGLSPEAEPTPQELARVVAEVREHGATTVFFESLVSPRLAETVARETGAATAALNPLEGLTEDERARGETYFSLMEANLEALREALACR